MAESTTAVLPHAACAAEHDNTGGRVATTRTGIEQLAFRLVVDDVANKHMNTHSRNTQAHTDASDDGAIAGDSVAHGD